MATVKDRVGGADEISLLRGFDAMRAFVEHLWRTEKAESDDIAVLLGSLDRNPKLDTQPLDVAQWTDWLEAALKLEPNRDRVRSALSTFKTIHKNGQPGPEPWHLGGDDRSSAFEAFEITQLFLEAYWERGHRQSRDFEVVLGELRMPARWQQWLTVVDAQKLSINTKE